MIRVLHVLTRFELGGIPNFIMNIYRSLNHEVVQFDFVVFAKEKCSYDDELLASGSRIFYIPKYNGHNFFKVRKAWTSFLKEHRNEYRILHSHVRSSAFIFLPLAKKNGLVTIEHSHSTNSGGNLFSRLFKKVCQFPLRYQANYLFACSNLAGQWLYGRNVLKKKNYRLIPNGIDVDSFKYKKDIRERLRKELGIHDSEFVVGHNGRFHEAKNHMMLLDIFKIIHSKNPNSTLLLVGGGDLMPVISKRIEELGIKDNVIITGMVSDYAQYYNVMDVFVFPSKWEGLPISVVEAQTTGLKCFISNKITNEVCLTDLVERLPIDKGPCIWADVVLKSVFNRKDVTAQIINAGFDIKTTSNELIDFYNSFYG